MPNTHAERSIMASSSAERESESREYGRAAHFSHTCKCICAHVLVGVRDSSLRATGDEVRVEVPVELMMIKKRD